MKSLAGINAYFAVVDQFGTFVVDWQQDEHLVTDYLYEHPTGKLLICQGAQFLDEQATITTIEPQLTLEEIGLHPNHLGEAGTSLIDIMNRLFGGYLDSGALQYGRAHAQRMAYLSMYFAESAELSTRDMFALIMAAYMIDMGRKREEENRGFKNFQAIIGGEGRLHATLTAIIAKVGTDYTWQLRDTCLVSEMLAVKQPVGWAKKMATYLDDIIQLELIRFGTAVKLRQLKTKVAARMIYVSREEFRLISDKNHLPYTNSKGVG